MLAHVSRQDNFLTLKDKSRTNQLLFERSCMNAIQLRSAGSQSMKICTIIRKNKSIDVEFVKATISTQIK